MTSRSEQPLEAAGFSSSTGEKAAVARILVVDDEALIRWSLREQLSQAGYEVAEAADGESAMTMLSSRGPFDLVLLDLKLPDMNGLFLLERIREVSPRCPVVMMSAYATPDDTRRAVCSGIKEIIAKPFDVGYLLRAVERELKRAA